MSIYSGFPTRKDEEKYNSLLSKLILTLQSHLLEFIGETVPQNKIKTYAKIINRMREYQQHKYLPPKFSDLMDPLSKLMGIDRAVEQKVVTPAPQLQPYYLPPQKCKLSSRSLHKNKFNPTYLANYQSHTSKDKKLQNNEQGPHLLENSLNKKQLFPSSSSKLNKPKVYKSVFPSDVRKIELADQYQQPSQVLEHWETFNKSKISKEGLPPKMSNNNFRYRAYQALQEAQGNVNKRPVPLREDMRQRLKTEGGKLNQSDLGL